MSILALAAARTIPGRINVPSPAPADSVSKAAVAGAGILQRNTQVAEIPDQRYWTAYDYYMIEREARAMRADHTNALLVRGWRVLTRRLFD